MEESDTGCLIGRAKEDRVLINPSALHDTVLWGTSVIISTLNPGCCVRTTAQKNLVLV